RGDRRRCSDGAGGEHEPLPSHGIHDAEVQSQQGACGRKQREGQAQCRADLRSGRFGEGPRM
ncbi:hypothetical protein LTR91_026707, partial [Friedmanniomyces endolithicus]